MIMSVLNPGNFLSQDMVSVDKRHRSRLAIHYNVQWEWQVWIKQIVSP